MGLVLELISTISLARILVADPSLVAMYNSRHALSGLVSDGSPYAIPSCQPCLHLTKSYQLYTFPPSTEHTQAEPQQLSIGMRSNNT